MEEVKIARAIFMVSETGYIGSRHIPRLLERGYQIRTLARSGSEGKLPLVAWTIGSTR